MPRAPPVSIADVLLVEQRLDGLRSVLVIQQHHSLGGALDALLDVGAEFGHGMEHRLARLDREAAASRA
ncbi:hypothetical protein [Ralstonia mannitolilytica]|uniref:hypothetical protein n=1 Tax=Ralstonia mannitolilytica TaxID=105219 RepID=UPI0012E7A071|nr:hypothetical protein [Ralstonia mannitolilytica]